MSRTLVALAALAVAAGIGATAYVVARRADRHEAVSPAAPALPPDGQRTSSPVDSLPSPAAPVAPPAEPAEASAPAAEKPDKADQAASEAAATAALDLKALVANLTPEQEDKLYKAVRKREHARRADDAKYWLPADQQLLTADLKLSDTQQKQIQAIKNDLRPRMDVMLAGVRAQFEDWSRRQQELWKNAKTPEDQRQAQFVDQIQTMSKEYMEINKLKEQITEPLDQEYLARVQAVLTPEQLKTLLEAIAEQKRMQEQWKAQWGGVGGGAVGGFSNR